MKNSWKDVPAPGTGLTYDLGSHLVDQALVLFGRPYSVTAFIENIRGIGDAGVDDCVSDCQFTHSVRRTHARATHACIS